VEQEMNRPPPHPPTFPRNAWYALATSAEVGRRPLAVRALDTPFVLYRTTGGDVVALEDRCVNRPYPLSRGRVDGDRLVDGYTGFVYGPDGTVLSVPSQEHVPVGARARAFAVTESDGFVWAWPGDPALAKLRPAPDASWLVDPAWSSFGETWTTRASALLLQDNLADITHVAVVDPTITPPALQETPPALQVEVSQTQVRFWREFPAAPVPTYQAELLGLPPGARYPQREEGAFISPGLWLDRWSVDLGGGQGERPTFLFTHAITPVDERTTRHTWRVSRNFAPGDRAQGVLRPIFRSYYTTVQEILETMQDVLDRDGRRREVQVSADAAMLQVRKIMRRIVAEES
jgi:phenylpropionate dioxygenase-like ring-hydroxylating dioxygenase large terminal subunit